MPFDEDMPEAARINPEPPDFMRRLGEFSVRDALLRKCPQDVARMLTGCVVLRAEWQPWASRISYVVAHPDLPVVDETSLPPLVSPMMHADGRVEWKPA